MHFVFLVDPKGDKEKFKGIDFLVLIFLILNSFFNETEKKRSLAQGLKAVEYEGKHKDKK